MSHEIPRRTTLVDQTVSIMKQGLLEGRWSRFLPTEHELCDEFEISRSTLRKALKVLHHQGVLRGGGNGRRRRVVASALWQESIGPKQAREVRVLSLFEGHEMVGITRTALHHLHREIEAADYSYRFYHFPLMKPRQMLRALKSITSQKHIAGWVLLFCPELMQQWFESSGLPVVQMGARTASIGIPSAGYDTEAMARDAMERLLQLGHRSIALLRPDFPLVAEEQLLDAMCQVAGASGLKARVLDVRHELSGAGVRAAAGRVLGRRQQPTAWVVSQPNYVWPLISCLQSASLSIPDDVSVVSRVNDLFLDTAVPQISCYRHNAPKLGRTVAAMVLSAVNEGARPDDHRLLMPEFFAGETLGPARG